MMKNHPSKIAALALAAALLAGQAGVVLAAESKAESKAKAASAQAATQLSIQQAQRQAPSPEEMQKSMQAMAPMMGTMMTMMLESMAKKLAEPQIAEYYATFMHNYYEALVKQGFTAEQALKIVSNTGIPSAGQQK